MLLDLTDLNLTQAVLGSLGFGITLMFAGGASNILKKRAGAAQAGGASRHPYAWRAASDSSFGRRDDLFRA